MLEPRFARRYASNDRLSDSRRRNEDTDIMLKQRLGALPLQGCQLSTEPQVQRRSSGPLILEIQLAADSPEQVFDCRKTSAWQRDV